MRITHAQSEKISIPLPVHEEMHLQSSGDIRYAIMGLQLLSNGKKSLSMKQTLSVRNDRDVKLNTFHALGKLLYAKRHLDGTLQFDPDNIMQGSDLEVSGSLRFIESHCIEFFTDICDLSNAYESFSDASMLLGTYYSGMVK